MINTLINLIIYILIVGILLWILQYVIDNVPLFEPFRQMARVDHHGDWRDAADHDPAVFTGAAG